MSFNSKELPLILGRCLLILMGFPLILRRSLVILRRCPVIIKRFPLIIRRFPFIIRRSPLMHDIILYGLCYIRIHIYIYIYIYIYCPVSNSPSKICFPQDAYVMTIFKYRHFPMVLIWFDMLLYVSKLVLSSGALNHVIDCPKSHNLLMCLNIWSATCRKHNMKTT